MLLHDGATSMQNTTKSEVFKTRRKHRDILAPEQTSDRAADASSEDENTDGKFYKTVALQD
jgi:hypothetical protein